MRKKHKNQLFNLISEKGYSPYDFVLEDTTEAETKIFYKNTPFYFIVRNSQESYDEFDYYFVRYAPEFPISEIFPQQGWDTFEDVLAMFSRWLINNIKEFESDEFEPDLWSEYKAGNTSLNFNEIDFNDKSNFSESERKQVSMAINELKLLINKKFNTIESEQILVNERLDYLIESSKKLNKFDWKSLVISTIIGIATTLTLDVEKGKLLYELFRQVFTNVRNIGQ